MTSDTSQKVTTHSAVGIKFGNINLRNSCHQRSWSPQQQQKVTNTVQCCRLLCEVQTPVLLKWTELGEQLAVGTRPTPTSNKHSCHVDLSLPLGCKRTMNNFFTATGFSTLPNHTHSDIEKTHYGCHLGLNNQK